MAHIHDPYVCPASFSGSLDNFLRRWLHKPELILRQFVASGMTVLDLGCGPGYFTVELAKLVGSEGSVIAADLQPEMLEKMLGKIKSSGLEKRVNPHLCMADRIGLAQKFDFILAFWMVHEVPDQERLFAELHSLLKPEGKILIAEPKWHVTRKAFNRMLETIEITGFKITGNPPIKISRSLVLSA